MLQRMIDISLLRIPAYEDVENDNNATGQAVLVVVLVAIASGVALITEQGLLGFVFGIIGALVGWAVWAFIVYLVGTRILPTEATHASWGQMARVLGFAQSPGILRVFGFIPILGTIIVIAVVIWQIVAMVIAVRQGLDYDSTLRAVGVVLIGFIAYIINAVIWGLIVAALN